MLDHFLDIFSKLVIGVISFIAPITSYLLSTYLADRSQILKRLDVQKNTIDDLLKKDIESSKEKGLKGIDILKSGTKKLKELEDQIRIKVNLIQFLDPKSKIGWLFSFLIFSVLNLLIAALVRGNVFNWYNHNLSVCLISLSCLSFVISMFLIGKIAWKLIEAKEIILEEITAINQAAETSEIKQEARVEEPELPPIAVGN